jgi:hypothetical protein
MSKGVHPEGAVTCTECGKIYPAFKFEGEWNPVGRDGSCLCGSETFEPVTGTKLERSDLGNSNPEGRNLKF